MEFRPLTYEEMCQMEVLHHTSNSGYAAHENVNALPGAAVTSSPAAVLPIMVIPTSVMPPGATLLTTRAAAAAAAAAQASEHGADSPMDCERYYHLQPTHLLASPVAVSGIAQSQLPLTSDGVVSSDGLLYSTASSLLLPQLQTPLTPSEQQQQQQQQQQDQQHPRFQQQVPQQPGTLNILYTGTLAKAPLAALPLTRKALESVTLPRGFLPADESDFEGSECGTSISTTTCMPNFRFSGCGMMLQPTSTINSANISHHHRQHHQQQHHQQEPQVIGCAALSHMMGSFASAAGGAMHPSRFTGTLGSLAGMNAGRSSTLSRNRRASSCSATTQTPKRVSFRGDSLPPEEFQLHEQHDDSAEGNGRLNADAFNNCSYVHFGNFMDYQTTAFGGLPDVTEHSSIRRPLSRQNSSSNSDSGSEIASVQKSKSNYGGSKSPHDRFNRNSKRKSKAPQQVTGDNCAMAQRYKSRRGSCVVAGGIVAAICLLTIAAILAYQHFFMAPSRNSQSQRLRIVRRILRDVPLVDGHNNFAWNIRKYAQNSLEFLNLSYDVDQNAVAKRPSWSQTDMLRLKKGMVGVQVWSAYVPCEAQGLDAVQLALEQIDIIRRLADMYAQHTMLATSSADIANAHSRGQMASLIGIEGGHAIGSSLGVLRSFYSVGARSLSLTHKCDVSWAGSSISPQARGLSQFGKALIREMNRLGMMVDLSYSSDVTARDVLQVTRAPVIFSHSAARQLCNSTRNVPDDILRLVADNGGLIMISFDSEDVVCDRQSQLSDVVAHIKHIRAIAGIQHIGLGAGYDGIEFPPTGLEDVTKYPELLATLLEDNNWSEEDIGMLAGKNFLRIMETVENVRDYWKRAAILPIEQSEPQPKSQCTYMAS